MGTNNNNKLKKQYEEELENSRDQINHPMNRHLQSFDEYVKWRQRMSDLFDSEDTAKDLY